MSCTLLAAAACGQAAETGAQKAPETAQAGAGTAGGRSEQVLLVDGLLNGGFELIADATTDPPKHGAYWVGACSTQPDDTTDLTIEDLPWRGARCLRLSEVTGEVHQKVVADPRRTDSLPVAFALRLRRNGRLGLTLEDGPGRRATAVLELDADGRLVALDEDGAPLALDVVPPAIDPETEAPGEWWQAALDLGALFRARHGQSAVPRLVLHLVPLAPAPALVDVDEIRLGVAWPIEDPSRLAAEAEDLVRWSLRTWLLPREQGGLELVDPETGLVRTNSYDVVTGAAGPPEQTAAHHTIHSLLVEWIREARRRGETAEVEAWTPYLERIVRTLLEHAFDPRTGLPRRVRLPGLEPVDDAAVPIGPTLEFLLDAREQLRDEGLRAACLDAARRTADALVELQRRHDLPPDKAPPRPTWNAAKGRVDGDTSNWFGHIPDRLTPAGEIETDKRFYTSWAILTGRSFWYELLRSPRALARVAALDPRPGDLAALHRAVGLYHRNWDASRYDLENDTDDHYGYLCEDALDILEHLGERMPDALALVQQATDHRLERTRPDGTPTRADDTLWIQAVRLGTACAGDSPRAFFGPLRLYELPPASNPETSGLPLYRDALLELARNDLQGRQLTNSQFTESFFKAWEMVCICFKGTYQGDCRDHPADWWQGDVGDTFGGPPTSAIDAQQVAWRVAPEGSRQLPLAALTLIRDVTDASLRRPWGYLFGLDPAVARQYELPEKYTIGLSSESSAGLGYVMAWARLLPWLPRQPDPLAFSAELVDGTSPGGRVLRIVAPPGAVIALPVAARAGLARVSDADARLLGLDLGPDSGLDPQAVLREALRVTVGSDGRIEVALERLGSSARLVQPLLLDGADGTVLRVGPVLRP